MASKTAANEEHEQVSFFFGDLIPQPAVESNVAFGKIPNHGAKE